MDSKLIKVLLVDDSVIALAILKRMLSSSPDIEVVGTARNGKEALELIPRLSPTVLCTDLHMPVMNGLEFTRAVMATHPLPILVVSVSASEGSLNAFDLLDAGAVDVLSKPRSGLSPASPELASELVRKIRILAGVHVFRRIQREIPIREAPIAGLKSRLQIPIPEPGKDVRIVVIGASTGGPQALETILGRMPQDFPLPVLCIQHISDGFLQGLVDWLSSKCRLTVKIVQPGELPSPGTIYFPQEGTHLKIDGSGRIASSPEPPFDGHRPSITITMRSAAHYYESRVFGVLLTGMGRDGAEGMQEIAKAGGVTIAQDEESSVVFGMPKQAIDLGAARYVLAVDEIAEFLKKLAADGIRGFRPANAADGSDSGQAGMTK
ncbi:MAG: chemotaxis-specific protein-glutamate methyltransferase CheB [Nitrospirae bacterium]|nr:chemotaxis-specific protein-glutamate methyltransferase CheB [Nitrospirota bacterium]